jgi:putative ABC transport system substrate-binding protein
MVLDPRSVVPPETELCGVALDIPAADQLREFTQRLPFLKRLGLVYNPAHNAAFAADAQAAVSAESGIRLIGLKVGERADILALIERQFHHIDTLWVIPDRTVVSESLIPFIIKAAMAKNVAVFGYNRYFADCGAAISLVRDYQAIGEQTAAMALRMLAQPNCRLEAPRFTTSINPQVLEKLGYPALPPTPADTPAERP